MSTVPEPSPPESRLAAALRGWGPAGAAATVLIAFAGPILEPLGAILSWAWLRATRTPWRAVGLSRPGNWLATVTLGILGGGTLKLVMKSLVMPLLQAPPENPVYHYLVGNTAALPGMLFDVIVGAGFNEELVFRGFLFLRLGQLLGTGRAARIATVLLTSAWFGLVHYPGQGLPGAQQATIVGLLLGTVYAIRGNLWGLMVAHAAFDIVAVALIYANLESRVAHLFFR